MIQPVILVDIPASVALIPRIASQLRFAISLAINRTVQDAQKAIQLHGQRAFQIRRGPFILSNLAKIARADFSTKDRLHARMHMDPRVDLLQKFEEGGFKSPTRGSKLAIPTDVLVGAGRRGVVGKSKRPKAFHFRAINTYTGRIRFVGDQRTFLLSGLGIFQRVGRRGKARGLKAQMQAGEVRMLYAFKRTVPIPRVLDWFANATNASNRTWRKNLGEAIGFALRTAR